MGGRFLRDAVNQTQLTFSDHADLEDIAIYIDPIEGNSDGNQVGMCCVVKRAELEKMMWWRKDLSALEDCLVKCMIGGNSIASNLIGILGPNFGKFKNASEASEYIFKQGGGKDLSVISSDARAVEVYEQWLCWNSLRKAQDLAEKILGRELEASTNDA